MWCFKRGAKYGEAATDFNNVLMRRGPIPQQKRARVNAKP
jgi:hypothetical protein